MKFLRQHLEILDGNQFEAKIQLVAVSTTNLFHFPKCLGGHETKEQSNSPSTQTTALCQPMVQQLCVPLSSKHVVHSVLGFSIPMKEV
jgi:hypothetical protein